MFPYIASSANVLHVLLTVLPPPRKAAGLTPSGNPWWPSIAWHPKAMFHSLSSHGSCCPCLLWKEKGILVQSCVLGQNMESAEEAKHLLLFFRVIPDRLFPALVPMTYQYNFGLNSQVLNCSVMSNSLQPHGLQAAKILFPWDFSGKNTGTGCHFLLQGIFLTQGSNPHLMCLLHCRQIVYHWAIREAPYFKLEFVKCISSI